MTMRYRVKGLVGNMIKVPLERPKQQMTLSIEPSGVQVNLLIDNRDVKGNNSLIGPNKWALKIPIGPHTITVTANEYETCFKKFYLKKGLLGNFSCTLQKKGSTYWTAKHIIGWSMVGAGAILTGVGIYLEIAYFNDKSTLKSMNRSLGSNKNYHYELISNKRYFGPILIGVGVATAASSYFLLRKKPQSKGLQSMIVAPTTDGGAVIGTTFNF